MSPRVLRAKCRVALDEMARRLGLPVADLRTLESVPLDLWEITAVAQYVAALGFVLRVVAIDADGREEALT